MSKKGVLIPFDLLDELTDYFQQRADVKDGSDGPRPNREMLLQGRLESEVTRPEAVPAKPAVEALSGVLDEIEDYLERHQDVRDGSDGPSPNEAMSLLQDLRWWRDYAGMGSTTPQE